MARRVRTYRDSKIDTPTNLHGQRFGDCVGALLGILGCGHAARISRAPAPGVGSPILYVFAERAREPGAPAESSAKPSRRSSRKSPVGERQPGVTKNATVPIPSANPRPPGASQAAGRAPLWEPAHRDVLPRERQETRLLCSGSQRRSRRYPTTMAGTTRTRTP